MICLVASDVCLPFCTKFLLDGRVILAENARVGLSFGKVGGFSCLLLSDLESRGLGNLGGTLGMAVIPPLNLLRTSH